MSFAGDLLIILGSYQGGYRLMRQRILGYERPEGPKRAADIRDSTMRVTLSRLKKHGFVENRNGIWKITKQGLDRLSRVVPTHHGRSSRALAGKQKTLIIAFDIPERQRVKRDWLRIELRNLGFTKLQQSVWFGPAPLPNDFMESLRLLNLISSIKFFKAREADII